jgi:hypothetical protein
MVNNHPNDLAREVKPLRENLIMRNLIATLCFAPLLSACSPEMVNQVGGVLVNALNQPQATAATSDPSVTNYTIVNKTYYGNGRYPDGQRYPPGYQKYPNSYAQQQQVIRPPYPQKPQRVVVPYRPPVVSTPPKVVTQPLKKVDPRALAR